MSGMADLHYFLSILSKCPKQKIKQQQTNNPNILNLNYFTDIAEPLEKSSDYPPWANIRLVSAFHESRVPKTKLCNVGHRLHPLKGTCDVPWSLDAFKKGHNPGAHNE